MEAHHLKRKRTPPPPAPKGNQRAKGNKGGGRKSVFRKHMIGPAKMLAKLGATNAEMAQALGISATRISDWCKKNAVFSVAVKEGKDRADNNVVESLYKRATGYSHPDVHISTYEGKPIITKITKHYPPDATSCIFWLKNRRPLEWREREQVQFVGEDGASTPEFIVHITEAELPKAK